MLGMVTPPADLAMVALWLVGEPPAWVSGVTQVVIVVVSALVRTLACHANNVSVSPPHLQKTCWKSVIPCHSSLRHLLLMATHLRRKGRPTDDHAGQSPRCPQHVRWNNGHGVVR